MSIHRYGLSAAAFSVFALLLAACGGGGSGSNIPAAPQAPALAPPDSPAPYTYVLGNPHFQALVSASGGQPESVISNSPFDLTNFGGRTLQKVVSHDVNVNCPATCWGTAGRGTANTFLHNLAQSNIIHVVDQYVGSTASDRYTVAADTSLTLALAHTVSPGALISAVHAAAVATKATGYGNVLHLFFPKGTDVCMTSASCYSPDNPATFTFCAFHDSVTFSDVGHVLFTIQPYQFVAGCAIPTAVPHGVIDATASTLSHELVEAITDPDPGSGWFNTQVGLEIGDECLGFHHNDDVFSAFYDIQSEYSNATHACVNGV